MGSRNAYQALAQLRAVAEFFRRTEPHSPVAYLADKAAKWGDVPLHLWLRSVMKDQASLAQIEEMLGIDPPPPQVYSYVSNLADEIWNLLVLVLSNPA